MKPNFMTSIKTYLKQWNPEKLGRKVEEEDGVYQINVNKKKWEVSVLICNKRKILQLLKKVVLQKNYQNGAHKIYKQDQTNCMGNLGN